MSCKTIKKVHGDTTRSGWGIRVVSGVAVEMKHRAVVNKSTLRLYTQARLLVVDGTYVRSLITWPGQAMHDGCKVSCEGKFHSQELSVQSE